MTTLDIQSAYKYVNLQMAAEALYGFDANDKNKVLQPGQTSPFPSIDVNTLTTGNRHASKFTATQAAEFSQDWEVIEHKSNTTTGFSGTLFKNRKTDEYVLSIRSTEFIDDAARDNFATNQMEIKDHGWAFGQIDDLEKWYQNSLKDKLIPAGSTLNVTGYSLGGHLATAFNLMHQSELNGGQVVTFNGAGMGRNKAR